MSIYEDIIRSQVKQGNLGGRNGALGSYARDSKEAEKREKEEDKERDKRMKQYAKDDEEKRKVADDNSRELHYEITLTTGTVSKAMDLNGLADPFIVIKSLDPHDGSYSKPLYKSKVCKKTLTPEWNETQTFTCKENRKNLVLELIDEDLLANDLIGRAMISTSSLKNGIDETIEFKLNSDEVSGTAKVKIQLKA